MINLKSARSFYKYGREQPHLPVIDYCLNNMKFEGSILEFGVWTGISANFIAKKISPKVLHAFDSFEGLLEPWNDLPKEYFKVDPSKLILERNIKIHKGWFNQTIPDFLINHGDTPISFINIDCDLYSSTIDILFGLDSLIVPGTIIYFDELYNYKDYRNGELKALVEWMEKSKRLINPIAYNDCRGVAIEIIFTEGIYI